MADPEGGDLVNEAVFSAPPTEATNEKEVKWRPGEAMRDLVARRREEAAILSRLAQDFEDLERAVLENETERRELEGRIRSLETELARARERLVRAEELLVVTPATAPASPSSDKGEAETEGAVAHFPAPAPHLMIERAGPSLEDIRLAQRYFNESTFVEKTRSVRRSLGRPDVNIVRVTGTERRILLTVAWEIVWYQYLVDLSVDPGSPESVTLFAEGMELDELSPAFKEPNANLDDDGRLDASELEVKLLVGTGRLLTDLTPEEEAALEDATEEVWDRQTEPEFRWDD